MKIVKYFNYGSPEVFNILETEKPIPKVNEVLVKIYATTVTATECTFRKGEPLFSRLFTGITKPKNKTLGEELSGEIVEVGSDVKLFKKGDHVFGTAGPEFGANAEYISLPEDGVLELKPENMTFEESASCVDGFLTSMPFLRVTGKVKAGQKVLIYGASGSVGSAAVQIAKYFDTEVTGVCSSSNHDMVKSIGADYVIDYKTEDFTKSSKKYDIIFDTVGKITFPQCKKSLKKNGAFLEAGIGLGIFPHILWTSIIGSKKVKISATGLRKPVERRKDLKLLKELIESGKIKPVIDRSYTLEQISDAHAYVDKGHKKGNVVITVKH